MKKLTAFAAALVLGTAAFAADGAKDAKKDKAPCCDKCKDGACKDKAPADKDAKAPEKKG